MALVINNKSALYGGVNQQSAVHRQETQVEEMINAYPTLNSGLVKRNPTSLLELSSTAEFSSDMWSYEYDRGLSGNSEEKYSIQIGNNGIQIINVLSGKVYKEDNSLVTLEGSASDYLGQFVNSNGYSAITLKDTTFIANKNVQPRLDPYTFGDTESSISTVNIHESAMRFYKTPVNNWTLSFATSAPSTSVIAINKYNYAPTKVYKKVLGSAGVFLPSGNNVEYYFGGSTTSILIDGMQIIVEVPATRIAATTSYRFKQYDNYYLEYYVKDDNFKFQSYNEYISNIALQLKSHLDSSRYVIDIVSEGIYNSINIKRIDGIAISTSYIVAFNAVSGATLNNTSAIDDYYYDRTYTTYEETIIIPSTEYEKSAFFWIKGSNPTAAYSYTYVLASTSHSISGTVSATTTEAAATALKNHINTQTGFTAIASGNIVKATTSDSTLITNIFITDTFGNQASYAWHMQVQYLSDLPKSMPYPSLVNVVDVENSGNSKGFWLKYEAGMWIESIGLNVQPKLDASTMPHILVRNGNDTFTVKPYDGWEDMRVGDSESNEAPSFVRDNNVIKDMFFFKNRLGFITNTTVVLSEVGAYGNFFRTSVAALLDGDRIDASVDTTKSISLEFATYIQDSIMLFSDKAQFKLDGGRVLSPDSVQVSQTSSYEINKSIRPIFMNNIIFFCAIRGDYTAVMQYFVNNDNVSEAIDITSHVDRYIPSDIVSMTASPINNMLFLTSASDKENVYVYRYYDEGATRVQSAWFKWKYDANIYRVFAMGRNLNFMTDRVVGSAYIDWVFGSGVFNDLFAWNDLGIWIDSVDDIGRRDNFEVQAIHPISHNGYFVDASEYVENTEDIIGLTGHSDTIGSLVYSLYSYITLDTTISLIDEEILDYEIIVTIRNNSGIERIETSISSDITILRSPYESIISIEIIINDIGDIEFSGFSFVYVGADTELLPNSLFMFGLINWTYTGWNVKYNNKDIGYNIASDISLGEWVYGDSQKTKQISGNLKMKSCIIDAEEGSEFGLVVENIARGTSREIPAKYTVGKKPIIFGDSKNIRLHITDDSSNGFRITSLSLEGNYNARDRRK